jgi:hypothetical protein
MTTSKSQKYRFCVSPQPETVYIALAGWGTAAASVPSSRHVGGTLHYTHTLHCTHCTALKCFLAQDGFVRMSCSNLPPLMTSPEKPSRPTKLLVIYADTKSLTALWTKLVYLHQKSSHWKSTIDTKRKSPITFFLNQFTRVFQRSRTLCLGLAACPIHHSASAPMQRPLLH